MWGLHLKPVVNWCVSIVFLFQFWTESFVQWSPLGTYLATIHRQGAAVWGGEKSFNRLMRYIHPQVSFALHKLINQAKVVTFLKGSYCRVSISKSPQGRSLQFISLYHSNAPNVQCTPHSAKMLPHFVELYNGNIAKKIKTYIINNLKFWLVGPLV